jgi:DNA-binding transcriptional MocR family regulator
MGGLHVWVELAQGIDTRDLLMRTQPLGVNFVPGSYFAIGSGFSNCLRISFGGLSADEIDFGIRTIGEAAVPYMDAAGSKDLEPAPALV